MGTIITLGIGKLELDWGKNSIINDHSALFQPSDIKQIPYYYAHDTEDKVVVIEKEGYSRKLALVKRRLDLLGYDLESIRKLYNDHVNEFMRHGYIEPLSFDDYFDIFVGLDIHRTNTAQIEVLSYDNGFDLGEYARKCIFEIPYIKERLEQICTQKYENSREFYWEFSVFLESLDPYILLRILCENPNNDELELYWSYADVVDEGYIKKEDIVKPLDSDKTILIVTEGSSDTLILKRSIQDLYPDIADFFVFIDMKNNYPFTGTGSLYNFCIGLCRIKIRNNVIVIFDNDTAGVEKYDQVVLLKDKPRNFHVVKLPDHNDFNSILTKGPHGETYENINGCAVAIECFLDFSKAETEPSIRWTTYNKNKKKYQGELEKKEDYVSQFNESVLIDGTYDTSKLQYLIDYLINCWIYRFNTVE